mmetsp:Transcript_38999/g.93866  ORF Transcript_38999/g.93866 Transcript_38999/m.93866 type:complete len:132 (+) Transcript_38999:466-861(+)
MQTVREGRGGRLVDDALDVQPGDPTGVLRRLPLLIVKMGRDRDHRPLHGNPQMAFGRELQLGEDHGGNLLQSKVLLLAAPVHAYLRLAVDRPFDDVERKVLDLLGRYRIVPTASDDALDVVDGVAGVRCDL